MKKTVKNLIFIIIGLTVILFINHKFKNNNIIQIQQIDKIKICTTYIPTNIIKINKVIIRDTIKVIKTDIVINDIKNNEIYQYSFKQDIKPDSNFQGAVIECISGFSILNNDSIQIHPIDSFNKIIMEPYPKLKQKEYCIYKKIGLVTIGVISTIIGYSIYENNRKKQ